jgi:hypothetical protein
MKQEYIDEWLRLSESGHSAEANDYYFSVMFNDVIDGFVERNKHLNLRCNVLFSILGYSPEPIILTQRSLHPDVHVIFTTKDSKSKEPDDKIRYYLGKYLTSDFKFIELNDDKFDTIYTSLKNQMLLYPSSDCVIDITGGKKSMVASAAIFGRDYNCNIVYVDYDVYFKNLRKPKPGTELLNVVYVPSVNLPEISFFKNNNKANTVQQEKKTPPKVQNIHTSNVTLDAVFAEVVKMIEVENDYAKDVNVQYISKKRVVRFYNNSLRNRFDYYIKQESFYDACNDYCTRKRIKDINSYCSVKINTTDVKRMISITFNNIVIALEEQLRDDYIRKHIKR